MSSSSAQAILATYDADELPSRATVSMEADLAFFADPDERKADDVDGSIGEDSMFHETHGYYGQGVSVSTATVPSGWRERLVPFHPADAEPCHAWCLDPHDLVIAKLVAGRDKDYEFTVALLDAELIDVAVLLERAALLDVVGAVQRRVETWLRRQQNRPSPP
jgi:hypothetical protein